MLVDFDLDINGSIDLDINGSIDLYINGLIYVLLTTESDQPAVELSAGFYGTDWFKNINQGLDLDTRNSPNSNQYVSEAL